LIGTPRTWQVISMSRKPSNAAKVALDALDKLSRMTEISAATINRISRLQLTEQLDAERDTWFRNFAAALHPAEFGTALQELKTVELKYRRAAKEIS
jgi:hypothetical protein